MPRDAPTRDELLVEFCVRGPAISAQSKSRSRLRAWRDTVQGAAKVAAGEASPFSAEIEVRLTEFSERRTRDRDNFAKPILDAMEGILFENDRQVAHLASEWSNIEGRYRVRYMSGVVAAALSAGDEFVWIRVFKYQPREALEP